MATSLPFELTVKFPERLLTLRKAKGFTQQGLADASGIHVRQFTPEEKRIAKAVIEGLILKHDAQRVARTEESR